MTQETLKNYKRVEIVVQLPNFRNVFRPVALSILARKAARPTLQDELYKETF